MLKVTLVLLFLLTGCTTFNHIEVDEPDVGFLTEDVSTLNPKLSWKPLESYEGEYDLIVFTRGVLKRWGKSDPARVVYYREGVKDNWHVVQKTLNKDYRYYWCVRKSGDQSEEAWSKYNLYIFGGFFYSVWLDHNFRFDIKLPENKVNAANQLVTVSEKLDE